jgi:hypothetical protein
MVALPPWRASSLSPSYVQYSLHHVSKLSTANRSCIKVSRCILNRIFHTFGADKRRREEVYRFQ